MPLRPEPQVALGRALRQLREEAGRTQEDAAWHADMSVSALSQLERGLRNPMWGTVRRLAESIGTTVSTVAQRAEQLESDN